MLTLDMTALGAAFIAMPGHKGLYGPQGTGVLLCGKDVPVRTLLEGGTGSISIQQEMPDFLPDRLEAGTHNMPGIAGLLAGVRFVRQLGPEAICAGERQLTFQAAEGLRRPRRGCFPLSRSTWTQRHWARPWQTGASPCGRAFTARPWPTAPPGRWTPAPSG